MQAIFNTRQFQAGNSQAVRLPAGIAFPAKTELVITRENDKIIVQPRQATLENVPKLFAALSSHVLKTEGASKQTIPAFKRPEFILAKRSKAKNTSTSNPAASPKRA